VVGTAFIGGGFGPLTEDEQLALLDIIEQLNERYGTNWGHEHGLFLEAQTAWMVEDPDVQEKFSANNHEKARIVFGELWQGAKFGSLDEHTDLVKSLVDNPELEKMLGDAVCEAVYRESRKHAESN
jgi:hypothetical protein